jgi:alpha-beta hydrolase superfamily lysophospholipase
VLINHGYGKFKLNSKGSHSNKFAHFASYFADNGIDTIGIDFRGFGKSEG